MLTSKITVYRNNKLVKGVRVVLEFTGFASLGFTRDFYTNSDGVAYVEHGSKGNANVYLDGKKVGSIYAPGSEIFYI
jgi:hypothetical protein